MMNLKKLFVVGSMLVVAWTTANAELVNGVRQKPEPATTAWAVGTQDAPYYLYNTTAKLFFTQGNNWGTRGCVGPVASALKLYFSETSEGAGTYYLNNYVQTANNKFEWKMACGEAGADAIYTDQGSGWGRPQWEIVPQTGNVFRIKTSSPLVVEDEIARYMGRDEAVAQDFYKSGEHGTLVDGEKRFPVSVELTEAEGHHIDWAIVSAADYEVVAAAMVVFDKAEELLTYINSAKEKNIDVAAEVAIYENEAATIDELKAAIASVQTKINSALGGDASVEKPSDMTGVLANPNFDDASSTGWKGTAPNMKGDGNHAAANVAEHYDKTFDTYQEISNMPTGVYALEANAFFRGSWEDHANHANYVAKLYAHADGDTLTTEIQNAWDAMNTAPIAGDKDSTYFETPNVEQSGEHDGVTYYIPSNPSTGRLYFEAGFYKNKLFFAVEEGTVRLGVSKDQKITGTDWVVFDNFKLSYYGKSAEAYQYWISQTPKVDYTGTVTSEQYLKAYDASFGGTATNKAEAIVVMNGIKAASDSIAKNTKLWADLQAKRDEAYGMSVNADYSMYNNAFNIGDYLESGLDENGEQLIPMGVNDYLDAEAKTGDYDLSNKQLEDIIATLNSLIEALNNEVKEGLKPYTDVTRFLTNPGFEDGQNGWTVVSKGGGNVVLGGNDDNHCFEAWHSTNFDVYQEVSNLPVGLYKLEVNGFVRYKDGDEAISKANEAPEDPGIYLYMNDSKTNLVNMMTCPLPKTFYDAVNGATYLTQNEENCFPNNMIAASAAFAAGNYLQETVCMVAEAGTVTRIGVKGTPEASFWPIFDNFKLTYLGNGAEIVKPQLEEKIAEAQKYDGEVTTKTAKANLAAEVSAAQALLTGEDGDAMLAALDKLEKAINDVKDGKAACQKFAEFIEDFMQFANTIDNQEALQLGATILENLNACAYDAEDIDAKKLELREMRLKVQLPADYAQGSAEGKNLTAFIQTPDFSKIKDGVETNSIEGWMGTTGYNFGNDNTQKGALALEFYEKKFDMYQDITSVGNVVFPAGNYCLKMNAFERVSDTTPAFLYATVVDGDTLDVKEVMKHAAGFDAEAGEAGPGDMVSSVEMFDEGKNEGGDGRYLNQLKFKFDGGTLRIGIKHENSNGGDWIIMDDFRLFFYGNDNTGVETVINIGKPAKVQYFTLDGRQVSVARKGLFIRKTTMDNGAVVVRKIQK